MAAVRGSGTVVDANEKITPSVELPVRLHIPGVESRPAMVEWIIPLPVNAIAPGLFTILSIEVKSKVKPTDERSQKLLMGPTKGAN